MKIKLTDEQRLKMTSIFATLNELRNDKKLMKMMKYCQTSDFDVTAENEDDVIRLATFHDDIRETSQYFDFMGYSE